MKAFLAWMVIVLPIAGILSILASIAITLSTNTYNSPAYDVAHVIGAAGIVMFVMGWWCWRWWSGPRLHIEPFRSVNEEERHT